MHLAVDPAVEVLLGAHDDSLTAQADRLQGRTPVSSTEWIGAGTAN